MNKRKGGKVRTCSYLEPQVYQVVSQHMCPHTQIMANPTHADK